LTGIPKLGKHISVSQVVEKFKVLGSIARIVLRQLEQSGALKSAEHHSKQGLYTPVAVAV
jgi:small subunit ribosomal protein S25e